MTKFYSKPTQISDFKSNKVSFGYEKIRLCFSQKDGTKEIILNFKNIFFFPSNPSILVSLTSFNNYNIF